MQEQNQKQNEIVLRNDSGSRKRVCLYFIAGDGAVQDTDAFNQQQDAITELINNTPGWQYKKIYFEHAGKHTALNELLQDCGSGKIDIIVTKSIWRFAGNIRETFNVIDRLSGMEPPVEVIFTDEAIFTFDSDKLEDLRKRYFATDDPFDRYYIAKKTDFAKNRRPKTDTDEEEKVK